MSEIDRVITALNDGFITDDALINAIDKTFIDMDGYEFEQAILDVPEPGNPDLSSFIDNIRTHYIAIVAAMLDAADDEYSDRIGRGM